MSSPTSPVLRILHLGLGSFHRAHQPELELEFSRSPELGYEAPNEVGFVRCLAHGFALAIDGRNRHRHVGRFRHLVAGHRTT